MHKILFSIVTTSLIMGSINAQQIKYPKARVMNASDEYFGTKVAEPYLWLEDDRSEETAQWVAAENKVTNDYLKKIPFTKALKERMKEFYNYEKRSMPSFIKGKYYFSYNTGLQNQSAIYVQESLTGEKKLVLDPNTLSDDGTVALQSTSISNDGRYLAYVIGRNGSDWNEIFVIDLTTGKQLDDHIMWTKFSGATWQGDGFYYSAYDAPKGSTVSDKNEYMKIYYHKIGTPQSEDRLEYKNDNYPLRFYFLGASDDERFLYLMESEGKGEAVYVKDTKAENPEYVPINTELHSEFAPIGEYNGKIYVLTNRGATRYQVLAYDTNNLSEYNYTTVIPEGKNVLEGASIAWGGHILCNYIEDACNRLFLHDINGKLLREIPTEKYSAVGYSSSMKSPQVFIKSVSYLNPGSINIYDIETNLTVKYWQPELKFNPDDYTTELAECTSKDGTPVKIFIVHKKGIKKDGNNPALVYGYGGFNVSMTPSFSERRMPYVEAGGVYAVAILRGGGEYGDDWYKAGTQMEKQNVFDDFIAASEYLISSGYTSASRLACNGASNGGLLIGAVVNQRPDLYAAAVPQVGVMDMLKYHKFTIGWNWAADYGRSDDNKEMFEYLKAYSPLHNIKNNGTPYPAILVTTGDHDDRVVPAHSFKYAATLQASNTGKQPKLIRIDSKAGHGGGKPVAKIIDEYGDIFAFIMYHTGMNYKKPKR